MVEQCGGTVWWKTGTVLWKSGTVWWKSGTMIVYSVVEHWNSDGGTVWRNSDGKTAWWNGRTVIVEQWNTGTVKQ